MKSRFKLAIAAAGICMLLTVMCSCGENSKKNSNETADETAAVENDGGQDASNDIILRENTPDSLPDGLNFNGAEVRILYRNDNVNWNMEIAVEDEIGEIVNDAIYNRNKSVEERLNVKIVPIGRAGTWDSRNAFLTTVKKSVTSGSDEYDLIAGYAYYITSLAMDKVLCNWNDVEYIEPAAEWWSADFADEMTVDGKLYYIAGDLSLTMLRNMQVVYFNKKIAADLALDNLYQIVLDGDFTIDKIDELTKSVYKDLNGSGKSDESDMFGFAQSMGSSVNTYYNAFDQPLTEKDGNGIPQLSLNTPKMIQIVDKMYSFFHENENTFALIDENQGSIITNMFNEDRLLFMPGELGVSDTLRAMNSDYGILPYPKWEKAQAAYHTVSHDSYSMFCIPSTCTKINAVGAVTEALCAESYRKVTPAYYEIALKQKYSRDEETSQMLDIARSGLTFNFGAVNSISMDQMGNIFRNLMSEKSTAFASRYEKSEAQYQTLLAKLVASYQDQ